MYNHGETIASETNVGGRRIRIITAGAREICSEHFEDTCFQNQLCAVILLALVFIYCSYKCILVRPLTLRVSQFIKL
jgi:hypothetical protein